MDKEEFEKIVEVLNDNIHLEIMKTIKKYEIKSSQKVLLLGSMISFRLLNYLKFCMQEADKDDYNYNVARVKKELQKIYDHVAELTNEEEEKNG